MMASERYAVDPEFAAAVDRLAAQTQNTPDEMLRDLQQLAVHGAMSVDEVLRGIEILRRGVKHPLTVTAADVERAFAKLK